MDPPPAPDSLRSVGLLDFIKSDPRPTFIFDILGTSTDAENVAVPVHWNAALAAIDSRKLLDTLLRVTKLVDAGANYTEDLTTLQRWAWNSHMQFGTSTIHSGYIWSSVLVKERWNIISGTSIDALANATKDDQCAMPEGTLLKVPSATKPSTFDWTCEAPPVRISPHVAWARSIDWDSTPLGPMSSWSSPLRSMANLIMQDPRPSVMFWGPEVIMMYNSTYRVHLGGLHPCMGRSARSALAEVWSSYFESIITQNLAGETVERVNQLVPIARNGFMEETYFSFSFIPVFNSVGNTVGHYQPLVETTREVIAERRAQTLLRLSEEVPRARNSDTYWALATEILSRNEKDIPFAILYSVESEASSDTDSNRSRYSENHQVCDLRGIFGLSKGTLVAPAQLDIQQDRGFAPYFRQAMLARNPIMVRFDEDSPASDLVRGVNLKEFGDCRAAAICPINPTSAKDNILGYLVIGLNPRRPYDDDYRQFVMVASRLLSTSLTSILLHEEDIHRRERAIANAESMKSELKQQLFDAQKEVARETFKFQRFAERADIGIFIVDMKGVYSYRNEAWYQILDPNHTDRDIKLAQAWDAHIDEEYLEIGQAKFETLRKTKQHQSFELRLRRTWTVSGQGRDDSTSDQQPMWILLSVFPELGEDGEVLELVGCFSDISRQKWGEKLHATQADDALESKRQLENFIDTTSHEMRNPLSAIVQCADGIIASHNSFYKTEDLEEMYRSLLDTTIDAAETIVQCSKHMKTIVDDVLTMSKLESGLFVMTPVDVQLQSTARDAVKMFEGEAKAAGVGLAFRVEDSCGSSNVDYVSLDPTRVLQILINLITNAIKFTRLEETRQIYVSLGISFEKPTHSADGCIEFMRTPEADEAKALQADWEKGEIIYIIFSVQDTGRGLSGEEHELLFARFSQASPRTHIDYGGSGLGLFISRRLSEMHGGAIGFYSKAKVGSTFSFYVKCRKSKMGKSAEDFRAAADATKVTIRSTGAALSTRSRDEDGRRSEDEHETASAINVLVVEDNLVNQRVLAKQLRNIGMTVAVANHGGEALDYLRTTTCCSDDATANRLSVILMDWEMPVMDGLTCVREIRKLQRQGVVRDHIPVIAVTANVRGEQVAEALKAGMDDVISKPFRIPELRACIDKTISRRINMNNT